MGEIDGQTQHLKRENGMPLYAHKYGMQLAKDRHERHTSDKADDS